MNSSRTKNESVILFPTFASRDTTGETWNVRIHAWVFDRAQQSLKRAAMLAVIKKALGLHPDADQADRFDERLRAFLVDNRRGRRISVRLGDRVFDLPTSDAGGHIRTTLELQQMPVDESHRSIEREKSDAGWLPIEAAALDDGSSLATGMTLPIGAEGISVVTDIDDTIKISEVTSRKELLENTFLRPFRPVPRMAGVYRSWAAHGAPIHYVSSSPWQLFEPLNEMLTQAGFPLGPMHLRRFRLKERMTLEHLSGSEEQKRSEIGLLLAAFPRRRFLFVGDSGERDPELYGEVARSYPDNLLAICIRNIGNESAQSERMQLALRDVPADRWLLFDDPGELQQERISDLLDRFGEQR